MTRFSTFRTAQSSPHPVDGVRKNILAEGQALAIFDNNESKLAKGRLGIWIGCGRVESGTDC